MLKTEESGLISKQRSNSADVGEGSGHTNLEIICLNFQRFKILLWHFLSDVEECEFLKINHLSRLFLLLFD